MSEWFETKRQTKPLWKRGVDFADTYTVGFCNTTSSVTATAAENW